jgi:hypothetical protein
VNRIEGPDMNPKAYDGEKTVSSTNVPGKSYLPAKKLKLDPC